MLGWDIIIFREGGTGAWNDPGRVVSWQAGFNGMDWLETMVKEGRAESLPTDNPGYPYRFAALWKELLPELLRQPTPYDGPPVIGEDYFMPRGWKGELRINREALALCQPEDRMLINVWDQS